MVGRVPKAVVNVKSQPLMSSFLKPKNPQEQQLPKSENNVDEQLKDDTATADALMTPPSKKLKKSPDEEVNLPATDPVPLTPEQKKMVNEKAVEARLIKVSNMFKMLDFNMGKTWFEALTPEFHKEYFKSLDTFVTAQRGKTTIYPKHENVWEWTKYTPINSIKVVILGQDPYHGVNQAHGLCFSVQKGIKPPPSLMNIYKELKDDITGFNAPNHGYLLGWTKQGVLLLNAVLTVEKNFANSHKGKGWEKVTDAVISWISQNLNGVVFLLWGKDAQKKAAQVDKKKHHILQCAHPSPFSAHNGFLGSKHFSKCNKLLEEGGKTPIDWNNLP